MLSEMSRPARRFLTCIAIALLGAVMPAGVAGARRAPTKGEAASISRALHASSATRAVRCFHTREIVISTAGPWARARVVRCGDGRRFDTALAVLQRLRGRWRVRDLGTSGAGCTVAPARVRRDLRLVCP